MVHTVSHNGGITWKRQINRYKNIYKHQIACVRKYVEHNVSYDKITKH